MGCVLPTTPEKALEEEETNQVPNSFITTMARQADTKIEVANPDYFPVGKKHCNPGITHPSGDRQGITGIGPTLV